MQHEAPPWSTTPLPDHLFPTARPGQFNLPGPGVIAVAARGGLSPAEVAFLRVIGTAPYWRTYDAVARAPAVDVVGGRVETPFGDDARWWQLPIVRSQATREAAHAGVARAAWHAAEGRRDSAEAALRAVVSAGFALIDNSPLLIEQLIGAVIVGVGKDGLVRFYEATGDPRAAAIAGAVARADLTREHPLTIGPVRGDIAAARARYLAIVAAPDLPRAMRIEALSALTVSACGDVRQLVGGPDEATRNAFALARRDLVRNPSDAHVIDLIERSFSLPPRDVQLSAARIASVLGRVYFNPRLTTCGLMATGQLR